MYRELKINILKFSTLKKKTECRSSSAYIIFGRGCGVFCIILKTRRTTAKKPINNNNNKDYVYRNTHQYLYYTMHIKESIVWKSWHVLHKKGRSCIYCISYKEGRTEHNAQARPYPPTPLPKQVRPLLSSLGSLVHALYALFCFSFFWYCFKKNQTIKRRENESSLVPSNLSVETDL